MNHTRSVSNFPTMTMLTIQKRFRESLKQAVRVHLRGNPDKNRWEVYPRKDWRSIIKKLRLVLSWVMGEQVLTMSPVDVLFHVKEQYKKLVSNEEYMDRKYGEYYV